MFRFLAAGLTLILLGTGLALYHYSKPNDLQSFLQTWSSEFKTNYNVKGELNLSDILKSRASAELRNIHKSLPHFQDYNENDIQDLARYAKSCSQINTSPPAALKKAWQWHQSVCTTKKPELRFYQTSPFMHPSGQSYSKLAIDENFESLKNVENQLHIAEVLKLESFVLEALINKESIVLNKDSVFIFVENESSNAIFKVYSTSDWNHFLSQQDFDYKTTINQQCLQKAGIGCWIEKKSRSFKIIEVLLIGFLILGLFAFGLFIYYFNNNRQLKKAEEKKRKFALQMLTHELRTPAASLSFLTENIRTDFDQLPENHKENFMRVFDEVLRLQNTTKVSYQYLQTDALKEQLIKPKIEKRDLINYLQNLSQKENYEFYFKSDLKKLSLAIDWFWLDICLQNLIRNAHEHGVKPVQVEIEIQNSHLIIWVIDQGQTNLDIGTMTEAFHKSAQSKGLGLGLSIVKNILSNLKLELLLQTKPKTQLGIKINRGAYEYTAD